MSSLSLPKILALNPGEKTSPKGTYPHSVSRAHTSPNLYVFKCFLHGDKILTVTIGIDKSTIVRETPKAWTDETTRLGIYRFLHLFQIQVEFTSPGKISHVLENSGLIATMVGAGYEFVEIPTPTESE